MSHNTLRSTMRSYKLLSLNLIVLVLLVVGGAVAQESTKPRIAVDEARAQLIHDALGWMTFRRNGQLMSDADVKSLFFEVVIVKYMTSKFYRTFVIAFQHGVLPKLTLKEGDSCDPAYPKEFKDPFNNSVTWHFQKNFTFDNYNKRATSTRQYCDYSQGLICHPTKGQCVCPDGSSLEPITPGSSVKRCLLQQDVICNLIDLDHGNDPKHSALASNLPRMIFNLEKPLSCQTGTQCRFKKANHHLPRCYNATSGPFHPPPLSPGTPPTTWILTIGDECALGLYASPGSCEANGYLSGTAPGIHHGFICFDFGAPKGLSSPPVPNRKGVCMPEHSPFGITKNGCCGGSSYDYDPNIIGFVHPGTVPLRGLDLVRYYHNYVEEVDDHFFFGDLTQPAGASCSVKKTAKMEQLWSYFASLEDTPPPGQDYTAGATKSQLNDKLQELISLGKDKTSKACQVYGTFNGQSGSQRVARNGTRCTPTVPNGDLGRCEFPGNLDAKTAPVLQRFEEFLELISTAEFDESREDRKYNSDLLLEHPEPPCVPGLTYDPGFTEGARGYREETLEHGYCPSVEIGDGVDSVCYEDFGDDRKIYDAECNLLEPAGKQPLICHSTDFNWLFPCEEVHLDKLIIQLIIERDKKGIYQEGAPCSYAFEQAVISRNISNFKHLKAGKYEVVDSLQRGFLCDKGRRLECKEGDGRCHGKGKSAGDVAEVPEKTVLILVSIAGFFVGVMEGFRI